MGKALSYQLSAISQRKQNLPARYLSQPESLFVWLKADS
jgi:hypothetical protein